jgi:hypothetical protein
VLKEKKNKLAINQVSIAQYKKIAKQNELKLKMDTNLTQTVFQKTSTSKSFPCDKCSLIFKNEISLTLHSKFVHKDKKIEEVQGSPAQKPGLATNKKKATA